MNESISFYRQALGMDLCSDQALESDALGQLMGLGHRVVIRAALLQSPGRSTGKVALVEVLEPALRAEGFEKSDGWPYPLHFTFSATNIPELETRARTTGARVITPPKIGEVPGKGPARSMVCLDPNGVWVELLEMNMTEESPAVLALRRVAVPVASGLLDRSMAFYQHTVDMKPAFDVEIVGKAESSSMGVGDFRLRFAALQHDGHADDTVGFIEYYEPALDVPIPRTHGALPHPVALAFLVDDLEDVRRRAATCRSPEVCAPVRSRVLGTDFEAVSCLDPSGILVGFYQDSRLN